MPTYVFEDKETGEVFDKLMKISEKEHKKQIQDAEKQEKESDTKSIDLNMLRGDLFLGLFDIVRRDTLFRVANALKIL